MVLTEKDVERIEKNFIYHPPKDGQSERYDLLRGCAAALAEEICVDSPDSRERALALTKLEEAIMWANAAIARNE